MNNLTNKNIVELLHEITQKDFVVSFGEDFNGMIRLDLSDDSGRYDHWHLGIPGQSLNDLEKLIINKLIEINEKE